VATAGSPEIQRELGTSYAELTVILMLVPGVLGLVLEVPLFLLADRWPRRRMIAGGLAVMAACALLAAASPGPITLALAISLAGAASGIATGLAEATMIDARPDRRAQTMTRWMLLGLIGDVVAPALLAVFAVIGLTWRGGYVAIAAVIAAWAIAVAARPLPAARVAPEPDAPGLWATLRETLRNRRLVGWLFALALCDLLDEILVVLASLHLRELGAGPGWRTVVIAAFVAGGAIGLVIVDRVLRSVHATRVLVGAGIACTLAYLAWLTATTPLASAILMVAVGATAAPLWPLATAQAYAANPGRSGAVLAASHLFTPFALALPWVLGEVADRWGLVTALALLVAQPIGIAVMAAVAPAEPPSSAQGAKRPLDRPSRRSRASTIHDGADGDRG
jgi:predicted MFS family arabinose efflux permease